MKVILFKNVPKVGQKYDIKDVSDGYALNFLIPQKLAEIATPSAIRHISLLKETTLQKQKIKEDLLAKNLKGLGVAVVEFYKKANEKGHLFSAIHKDEIVSALKDQARLDVEENFIKLEHPIKEVGEHSIAVKVGDKEENFTIVVKAL